MARHWGRTGAWPTSWRRARDRERATNGHRKDSQIHTPIALITGASRGLGRSAALKLAERGSDVILTCQSNAAEAHAVVQQIEQLGRQAVALPLDVGDSQSFAAFAEQVKTAGSLASESKFRAACSCDPLTPTFMNRGLAANR